MAEIFLTALSYMKICFDDLTFFLYIQESCLLFKTYKKYIKKKKHLI